MTNEGKSWDFEIIEDLFDNADRDLIGRIPLSTHVNTDSWY